MCNLTNEVPQAFDWDAASQKQLDRWARPELNHAVVEFVAPQEYMVRPPQPLVYLFLFDVSYSSVTNGLLATGSSLYSREPRSNSQCRSKNKARIHGC